MKITKEKLRQIVLEEAIKLEEGQIASDIASTLLPGSGEYGQGAYASNIRDKKMEQRVYERSVLPYAQAYHDIGKEYGISPNLIAGIMMDEDIRRYPDLVSTVQQAADFVPDFTWLPGGPQLRDLVLGDSRPAVGMGSLKLDSIIKDLAQNINPATGAPYIDLNKELGLKPGVKPAKDVYSGMANEVEEWLQKPENAIRATAARLAYDRDRFASKNISLTDQELATVYSDYQPSGSSFKASDRGDLAVTMGNDWLKPDVKVEDWWPGMDPHAQMPEEEEDFPATEAARVGIPEGVILDMIKGAIKELL